MHILNLPAVTMVKDGGDVLRAQTHYGYDESSLADAAGIVGHDENYGIGFTVRGNLTNPATCLLDGAGNCNWINHCRVFDIAGNIVVQYEANCGTGTQFRYNDYGQNKYALPTSWTNAAGHTTSVQYDYGVSKPISMTDPNGATTTYAYNDPLDRVTQIGRADGGQRGYIYENPT